MVGIVRVQMMSFTASGMPRVDQMAELTGFEVSPADRDRLWLELRQGAEG